MASKVWEVRACKGDEPWATVLASSKAKANDIVAFLLANGHKISGPYARKVH